MEIFSHYKSISFFILRSLLLILSRLVPAIAMHKKKVHSQTGITGGGARVDTKFQEMKVKPTSPDGFPVFKEGKVKKAGQHFKDKWKTCYLMSHGNKLSVADDEGCNFHQHITVTKETRIMLLSDPQVTNGELC